MSDINFTLHIINLVSRLASQLRTLVLDSERNQQEIRAILSTMQNLEQLHTSQFGLANAEQLANLANFIEPLGITDLYEIKQTILQYSIRHFESVETKKT